MEKGHQPSQTRRPTLSLARPAVCGLIAGVLWLGVDRAIALRRFLPPYLDVLIPTLIAPMALGAIVAAVDDGMRSRRQGSPPCAKGWLVGAVSAVVWWVLPSFVFVLLGLPLIAGLGAAIGMPIQRALDGLTHQAPLLGLYVGRAIAGGLYLAGWTVLGVAVIRALLGREPWQRHPLLLGAAIGAFAGLVYGGVVAALWLNDPNTWLMSPFR